eukprot:jgi/Psemu1/282881/fgenesh1_pg.15_\
MEQFSADANSLTSFDSGGLPSDFFVEESATEFQPEAEHESFGEESFPMHRKLLRRRHVRKLQKSKERERQRKEEEEKQKRLTRERNEKRRVEKTRSLRQNGGKLSTKRKIYSPGIREMENRIASPVPVHGDYYISGINNNNNNNNNIITSYCTSSPTSVLGLYRTIISTAAKSSPQAIGHRTSATMTAVPPGSDSGSMDMNFRRRVSFSLPEFSPVRPTKFLVETTAIIGRDASTAIDSNWSITENMYATSKSAHVAVYHTLIVNRKAMKPDATKHEEVMG